MQTRGPYAIPAPELSGRADHILSAAEDSEDEDPRDFPLTADFLCELDRKAATVGDWTGYAELAEFLEDELGLHRIHQLVEAAGPGKETTGAFLTGLVPSLKLGPANMVLKAATVRVKSIRKCRVPAKRTHI